MNERRASQSPRKDCSHEDLLRRAPLHPTSTHLPTFAWASNPDKDLRLPQQALDLGFQAKTRKLKQFAQNEIWPVKVPAAGG